MALICNEIQIQNINHVEKRRFLYVHIRIRSPRDAT